jgi:hypothetical protein
VELGIGQQRNDAKTLRSGVGNRALRCPSHGVPRLGSLLLLRIQRRGTHIHLTVAILNQLNKRDDVLRTGAL